MNTENVKQSQTFKETVVQIVESMCIHVTQTQVSKLTVGYLKIFLGDPLFPQRRFTCGHEELVPLLKLTALLCLPLDGCSSQQFVFPNSILNLLYLCLAQA